MMMEKRIIVIAVDSDLLKVVFFSNWIDIKDTVILMRNLEKRYLRLVLVLKIHLVVIGILWSITGSIYAAELGVAFERTLSSFSNITPSHSSGSECIKPLAWDMKENGLPKLLLTTGPDYMKGPANDIHYTLIRQNYSADGNSEDEVLANVVGAGIESGYATSIKGRSVVMVVDYASRVSLAMSSGSNSPMEIKSIDGKSITGGSKAKLIATDSAVWLITQRDSEVVLDKYDENLKLISSVKVKSALPSSARLMDVATRDEGHTVVLVVHELPPNVSLARVQLMTVDTATGKVIQTASADGFNPVAVAYGDEVYFSRVALKGKSGKRISEVWIGKLSADGKKITEWQSHKQEAGTLFSSLVVTKDQVNLISARGYHLFIKSFSKRGALLTEYQDTSKFQSPLFGYPAVTANNQLLISQVYREGEVMSMCGGLRVIGFK
jgi:hypothetical protein